MSTSGFSLLGAVCVGSDEPAKEHSKKGSGDHALDKSSTTSPSKKGSEDGGKWSAGKIVLCGVGGAAGLALLAFGIKHRDLFAVEARATGRQIGQFAGRAKSVLKAVGGEHRQIRETVAQERKVSQAASRVKKLEAELVQADRRVSEATQAAAQKASQLQSLRALAAG